MEVVAYMRVAKTSAARKGYAVNVTKTPSAEPLYDGAGNALPTVAFGIKVDIPDVAFDRAKQIIATIVVPEEAVTIPTPQVIASEGR